MLTAAVAAPVEIDRKSHAIADAPTRTHFKHHGEPMHRVSSAISHLPTGTLNTQAMQSSALATPANLPPRGQLGSVPAAAESLPAKRGEGPGLDDIGDIGHLVDNLATRAENAGIGELTDVINALKGLVKRELDDLARHDEEKDNADNEDYTKHGDTMLNDMNSVFHKAGEGKDRESQETSAGEKTVDEATKAFASLSNKGPAKGPLGKRQLPPIAGADLVGVVKGIMAKLPRALAPVTEGMELGGTVLGDLIPE
ncbi:hypothetical protein PISL3812_03956 [Talaromyces islandicus]|uniref:Uncharacterized protein n=1 Tax=Talaromyces islandicus TaxID=28573 RepID=A0A0U1LU61_TALIS|nr:hypothetical protein PISL3812_03956 [Talaromyces islandicus]